MKILLDTHIAIWALCQPDKLKKNQLSSLENPANELWLSAISIWEIRYLLDSKALSYKGSLEELFYELSEVLSIREAPFSTQVVFNASKIKLPHKDPADWMIAATARALKLKLMSEDKQIKRGTGFELF